MSQCLVDAPRVLVQNTYQDSVHRLSQLQLRQKRQAYIKAELEKKEAARKAKQAEKDRVTAIRLEAKRKAMEEKMAKQAAAEAAAKAAREEAEAAKLLKATVRCLKRHGSRDEPPAKGDGAAAGPAEKKQVEVMAHRCRAHVDEMQPGKVYRDFHFSKYPTEEACYEHAQAFLKLVGQWAQHVRWSSKAAGVQFMRENAMKVGGSKQEKISHMVQELALGRCAAFEGKLEEARGGKAEGAHKDKADEAAAMEEQLKHAGEFAKSCKVEDGMFKVVLVLKTNGGTQEFQKSFKKIDEAKLWYSDTLCEAAVKIVDEGAHFVVGGADSCAKEPPVEKGDGGKGTDHYSHVSWR